MADGKPQVWCVTPAAAGGWGPITTLTRLIARLWQSEPRFIHPAKPYGTVTKLVSQLPRRRANYGPLLIVAAHPGDLLALARASTLLRGFSAVHAWIIDSFWHERIPLFARRTRTIDRVWITDYELVDYYADTMRVPCGWAPWGSDALALARLTPIPRTVDVLRLGRQPAAWHDDDQNRAFLETSGLSYQGIFPSHPDGVVNHRAVLNQLRRARVALVSSNLASPADYTHATRDYITARFTDAVACGTLLAGQFPTCHAAQLIPQLARVQLDIRTREAGIAAIEAGIERWSLPLAAALQAHALRQLDWRHRIRNITREMQIDSPALQTELAEIDRQAASKEKFHQ